MTVRDTLDYCAAFRTRWNQTTERSLLDRVYRDPGLIETTVGAAMDGPFPTIPAGGHIDDAFNALLGGATALVVMEAEQPVGIITRLDLLEFMAHTRATR